MFYTYTYHIAYSVLEGHTCSLSKAGKTLFFSLDFLYHELGMSGKERAWGRGSWFLVRHYSEKSCGIP